MRHLGMAAAAILTALAPGAAWGHAITERAPINVSGGPDYNGSFQVVGITPFDPALGMLTGVDLTFSGKFTPGFLWSAASSDPNATFPATAPVTVTGMVGVIPNHPVALRPEDLQAVRLGSGPIAVYSYTAIGKPEPFSISATVSPADFNAAEFDLFAWTQLPSGPLYGMPPSWTPLADLMNVEGRLTVKYLYASADPAASVPEPSSLALLGVGLFGIGTIRKTRSRFQRLRAIGWRATADDDEHYVYAIGPPTKAAAPDLPIFRSQTHRGSCHRQQCDDASAVPFLEAEV